jgi:hypothetical protein
MLRSRVFLAALTFFSGVGLGSYLFSDSKPRSFLALSNCDSCYRPSDLAGLLMLRRCQRPSDSFCF